MSALDVAVNESSPIGQLLAACRRWSGNDEVSAAVAAPSCFELGYGLPVPSSEQSGGQQRQRRQQQQPERSPHAATKAERQAARDRVGAYHEAELAKLIERVRVGLARYDAREIDAFELDDLIHRYKRATQKLWGFCVGSGGPAVVKAGMLKFAEQEGELPDWWAASEPRRDS